MIASVQDLLRTPAAEVSEQATQLVEALARSGPVPDQRPAPPPDRADLVLAEQELPVREPSRALGDHVAGTAQSGVLRTCGADRTGVGRVTPAQRPRPRPGAEPEARAVQQLAALEDVLEDARGRLSACLRLLDAGPGLHLVGTSGTTVSSGERRTG